MQASKRTRTLLAATVLGAAALLPLAASAHTHVFLGINLGGLLAPPVAVYAPPVYVAPPPPAYYAPPGYYDPPVVYAEPEVIYYGRRGHDRRWHGDWRRDRDRHDDHGWHHRWHHDDDDD